MRFGPLTKNQGQDNPKPLPTTLGRKGSSVTASLDENKQLTVHSGSENSDSIPEEIVYGYLFRSILMFKEKAAEEEKQGRLGTGYTKAVQETLKIDDATAKALDEAATAWNPKKEEMSTMLVEVHGPGKDLALSKRFARHALQEIEKN